MTATDPRAADMVIVFGRREASGWELPVIIVTQSGQSFWIDDDSVMVRASDGSGSMPHEGVGARVATVAAEVGTSRVATMPAREVVQRGWTGRVRLATAG